MDGSIGDVRAHCGGCARWFSIPSDTVHAMMQALCPFCFATADQLEQRCGDIRIALEIDGDPVAAPSPELAPT
jgi:sarcosine oxidase delta subunit